VISLASLDSATPFGAQLARASGPVLLVIAYVVPENAEAAMRELWTEDVARMAARPGFLSAQRYPGAGGSRMWHTTVEWKSPHHLAAALDAAGADAELQAKAAKVPEGVVAYPNLFERAPADEVWAQLPERNPRMPENLTVANADRQRQVIDEIYEIGLNGGDLSIADKHLTAGFRNHGSHDDSLTGPDAFKLTITKQRSGFSEVRYEILDFLSMGERACVRWVMHGVHTGEFIGIPPTGKRIEHHAILIVRFEGDKIAERWGIVDNFGLMRQLRGGPPGPPAPRPLPEGVGIEPIGQWSGAVTYEGKRDEFTVELAPEGKVVLNTEDSAGSGTWSMNADGTFSFSIKEEFIRAADGTAPAKVLPGAAYVQIHFLAKATGETFGGNGVAEVRGFAGELIASTVAEMVATRIAG
jgi:predicted ester cyclase